MGGGPHASGRAHEAPVPSFEHVQAQRESILCHIFFLPEEELLLPVTYTVAGNRQLIFLKSAVWHRCFYLVVGFPAPLLGLNRPQFARLIFR